MMKLKTLRKQNLKSIVPTADREDILKLQKALMEKGFSIPLDGIFGHRTEDAVITFQQKNGLTADGIVGPDTWRAFGVSNDTTILPGFHGDLAWVHAREGHRGSPYWPGGASGITLDPGVDLGYAAPNLVQTMYGQLLSGEQMAALKRIFGLKGEAAKTALAGHRILNSIVITRDSAGDIFPYAARPYWEKITDRFPGILTPGTLSSIHTVMLSLAYNRGPGNKALSVLDGAIEHQDWAMVADIINGMQQDHHLPGIRKRRRDEADLIRRGLGI